MDPPFYTLSSGSSSTYTDNNPLTPPSPTTHDTSRSTYHISDIGSFADSLQSAANQAFPNRGRSRYHTVNVCLIRWAEDSLNVSSEVNALHDVFSQLYGFNTEIWWIPSTASQIQLTSMTCSFLQKFDEEGNLFIVYYGGHGTINNARQNQWYCSASPDSQFVDWSAIQTLFSSAVSDVLILLDCCAAASSAPGTGPGTMEAIAACGWETRAPPPGEYSFTHTLIEVLEEWACKPSFSAAMLHTEVLFVLKQKRPERGRDGRRLEWCSTPIHWVYTSNPRAHGIELSSLLTLKTIQKSKHVSFSRELQEQFPSPRSTAWIDAMDIDSSPTDEPLFNPLTETRPNGDFKVPHVLISLALESDQTLDNTSCRRWLADFPALVKYATIEGVYKSYSTLLTLSVPMPIWDLLPENPACSFIGYITTPNKYAPVIRSGATSGRGSFSNMYTRPPFLLRSRKPDGLLRSADSSYGSDGETSEIEEGEMSTSGAWFPTRLSDCEEEDSSNECAIDDGDDSSSWEDSVNGSYSSGQHDVVSLESGSISSKPESGAGKSLLSKLLDGVEATKPIPISKERKGEDEEGERYRSPDQKELDPRMVRRNMLASELSSSLRRHLLWERRQGRAAQGVENSVPVAMDGDRGRKEERAPVGRRRSSSL